MSCGYEKVVKQITEAAMQKRYAEMVAKMPAVTRVHARHILVKTRDEAAASPLFDWRGACIVPRPDSRLAPLRPPRLPPILPPMPPPGNCANAGSRSMCSHPPI